MHGFCTEAHLPACQGIFTFVAHKTKAMKRICMMSLFLFLWAACTGVVREEVSLPWERVDSLLPARPDSARQLLLRIRVDSVQGEGVKARYALLRTEADIRCGRPLTDDSLILSAVAYYDRAGDVGMQARAHYWAGNAYRLLKEEENALQQYWRAEELARRAEDKRLLGVIYNNWAYLYCSNGLQQEADSLYALAGRVAVERGDSLLLAESLCRRALIAMDKGKMYYPQAQIDLLQGYEIAGKIGNKQLLKVTAAALSSLYARLRDGVESIRYAKLNLALQADTLHCYPAYMLLGEAYYQCGQYDSATYYVNKALKSADAVIKSDVYMRLADIAKIKGDYALSVEMERKHSAENEAYHTQRQDQIQKMSEATGKMYVEREQTKRHRIRTVLLWAGGLLIALIPIGGMGYCRSRRQRERLRKENAELNVEQIHFKELLHGKEAEIATLQAEIAAQRELATQEQRACLEQLQKEKAALQKEEFEHLSVYDKMKHIMENHIQYDQSDEKMTEADWRELEEASDRRWNRICLKLRMRGLTPVEIRLCCLRLADFPVSKLVCLFNRKRDFYYKVKDTILTKRMKLPSKEKSLEDVLWELVSEEMPLLQGDKNVQ